MSVPYEGYCALLKSDQLRTWVLARCIGSLWSYWRIRIMECSITQSGMT